MSKGKLKKEDILHLAKLSNLQVSESEIDSLSTQLDETITYIENLNELDTASIAAKTRNSDQTNIGFEDGEKNSRQLQQADALVNSKHKKGKYFVVSRII